MALNPPALFGSIMASQASGGFPMGGPNFIRLAIGVASGVVQWAVSPAYVSLLGAATGVLGAGSVIPAASKIIVPPVLQVMQMAFAGAGMLGPLSQSLAIVMTQGVAQGLSATAQYSGVTAGVGVGQDVSKVISTNPGALAGILTQTLTGSMGGGGGLSQLVQGLSVGIAGLLLLGTGTGTVAGAPIFPFPPSVGATIGLMV